MNFERFRFSPFSKPNDCRREKQPFNSVLIVGKNFNYHHFEVKATIVSSTHSINHGKLYTSQELLSYGSFDRILIHNLNCW